MYRNPLLQGAAVLAASWATVTVAAACSSPAKQPVAQLAAQGGVSTAAPALAGGSFAQAKPVSLGVAEIGEIVGETSNFYRFDNAFKVRDVAIVRVENLSSTLRPRLRIYDANRSALSDAQDGTPGASVEQAVTLEPGKRIYVEVLPCLMYGGCSTGKYALRAKPQRAFDALEPNDDVLSASPAKVGQDIVANIMDDKDSDWLHFTGAPQKPLTVVLENLSTTLKPHVRIYNSNKSGVFETQDGTPGANLSFPLPPEAGTDFYIEVQPCLPYGAGCSTGKYKLSVK